MRKNDAVCVYICFQNTRMKSRLSVFKTGWIMLSYYLSAISRGKFQQVLFRKDFVKVSRTGEKQGNGAIAE